MKTPYWKYETSVGETISVSVRMGSPVSNTEYQIFLSKFITHNESRISNIERTSKFLDESVCTIIHMNGRQPINYSNKR